MATELIKKQGNCTSNCGYGQDQSDPKVAREQKPGSNWFEDYMKVRNKEPTLTGDRVSVNAAPSRFTKMSFAEYLQIRNTNG